MTKSIHYKKITLATLWKQTNIEARDYSQEIAVGVGEEKENGAPTHGRWKNVPMLRKLRPGVESADKKELLLRTRQTLSLFFSVQTFDSTPTDGLWKLFLSGITI